MSNGLTSEPTCPVDPQTRERIEREWAWLSERLGPARVQSARVILPTPDVLPDAHTVTRDEAQRLLDRVCDSMGAASEAVELTVYQDCDAASVEPGRQWTDFPRHEAGVHYVRVTVDTLHDPLALMAEMAWELGRIQLSGHGAVSTDDDDRNLQVDLITVLLGMGVFTANAVVGDKHRNSAMISRMDVDRSGSLRTAVYGYALARFAHSRSAEWPSWSKHVHPRIRAAFYKAHRILAAPPTDHTAYVLIAPGSQHVPNPRPDTSAPDTSAPDTSAPDDALEEAPSLNADELLDWYQHGDRDFRRLDLHDLLLRGADLRGSNLSEVDFCGADLTDALLKGANLCDADLQGAALCGADLRGANLNDADLSYADLSGADLSGADIRGADFQQACLDNCVLVETVRDLSTDFSTADLSLVVSDVNLSDENLQGTMLLNRLETGVHAFYLVFCFILAMMFCGTFASCTCRMIDDNIRPGPPFGAGMIGGAIVYIGVVFWICRGPRKKTSADNRTVD